MTSISASATLAFKQADAGRDGKISTKELKQAAALLPTQVRQAIQKNGAQNVLNDIDADGDGSLSRQELSDGMAALVDTNAASVLIKAQESQNQTSQMRVGLKSGAYASLVNINTDATTTAMQSVLSAYANGGKKV